MADAHRPPAVLGGATSRRRWGLRRKLTTATLLVLVPLIGLGGWLVIETLDALSAIHSVSTPAPELSSRALDERSSGRIDTGPAQTAVAESRLAPAPPSPAATRTSPTTAAASRISPTTAAVITAGETSTSLSTPTVPRPVSTTTSQPQPQTATATATGVASMPASDPTSGPSLDLATATAASIVVPPEVVPDNGAPSVPAAMPTAATRSGDGDTGRPAENGTPHVSPSTPGTEMTLTPTTAATLGPTPVLSAIELVTNGGFEQGMYPWYVESGATIGEGDGIDGSPGLVVPSGGFVDQGVLFVPGTTYVLSASVSLGGSGGSALMGMIYRDGDGRRLADAEPSTAIPTAGGFTRLTLTFVPPAGAGAIRPYFWNPSGPGTMIVDDVSLRSVVPASDPLSEVRPASENAVNILVMGVDRRPGEALDVGVRPDSLMVMRLNPDTGSCRLLAIPRDTRTELPGYGLSKINHALAIGGIPYAQLVVGELLGIPIDHYVLVDFSSFQQLVDAVGGVEIEVDESFVASNGAEFSPGPRTLNGEEALVYSQWRGGPDGDFGRIRRQQQVLRALVQRAQGVNLAQSVDELLPALADGLRTDLSTSEVISTATQFRESCHEEDIVMERLDGFIATFDDPILDLPLSYVVVDEAEIRRKVAGLLEP